MKKRQCIAVGVALIAALAATMAVTATRTAGQSPARPAPEIWSTRDQSVSGRAEAIIMQGEQTADATEAAARSAVGAPELEDTERASRHAADADADAHSLHEQLAALIKATPDGSVGGRAGKRLTARADAFQARADAAAKEAVGALAKAG